jgi:uncharacterized protein with FMN-binding domain
MKTVLNNLKSKFFQTICLVVIVFLIGQQSKTINTKQVQKFSEKNKQVLLSENYVKDVHGYGGPLSLAISVDKENKVEKVEILKYFETKAFMEKVIASGLLSAWDGHNVEQAISLDVDVVSGATLTSSAVIENVQRSLKEHYRLYSKKMGK